MNNVKKIEAKRLEMLEEHFDGCNEQLCQLCFNYLLALVVKLKAKAESKFAAFFIVGLFLLPGCMAGARVMDCIQLPDGPTTCYVHWGTEGHDGPKMAGRDIYIEGKLVDSKAAAGESLPAAILRGSGPAFIGGVAGALGQYHGARALRPDKIINTDNSNTQINTDNALNQSQDQQQNQQQDQNQSQTATSSSKGSKKGSSFSFGPFSF